MQKTQKQESTRLIECMVTKDCTLAPHSMELIDLSMKNSEAGEYSIAGNRQWLKKGVILPHTTKLVHRNEHLSCIVQNISEERVDIGKNQCIATAELTKNVGNLQCIAVLGEATNILASAWPKDDELVNMISHENESNHEMEKESAAENPHGDEQCDELDTKKSRVNEERFVSNLSPTLNGKVHKRKRKRHYRRFVRRGKDKNSGLLSEKCRQERDLHRERTLSQIREYFGVHKEEDMDKKQTLDASSVQQSSCEEVETLESQNMELNKWKKDSLEWKENMAKQLEISTRKVEAFKRENAELSIGNTEALYKITELSKQVAEQSERNRLLEIKVAAYTVGRIKCLKTLNNILES